MEVEQLLDSDRFARVLGARLVEATPDRLVVELEPADHHLDAGGRISAGVLFSLADCAMSLISNTGRTAVAVAAQFTPTAPIVPGGPIRAEARRGLPPNGRADTWLVTLMAEGGAVGSFTGTTLRVD
ncbi:MAG: PaaI family thioesterase [Actinomycetota bacterium]